MLDENNEILNELSGFLLKTNSILFTFAQDMMLPVYSESISTACVVFKPNEEKCIHFLVNKTFWEELNYNEKIFIFIHETLHVLFSHGKRGKDFMDNITKKFQSQKLLNVCMDICINEIIVSQYLNDIPLETMPIISNGCFIHTVFGDYKDLIERGKSFEYYYQKYIELYGEEEIERLNLYATEHTFMDIDLDTLEEIQKQIDNVLFDKDQHHNLNEDSIEEKSTGGFSIGSFSGDDTMSTPTLKKQPDSLETHLDLMISTSFERGRPKFKNQWYGVNRRTDKMLENTGMFLPIRKEKHNQRKHKIIVYSDVSGSCAEVSKRFLSLVVNLDQRKYETDLYVFADRVAKCQVVNDKVNMPRAGYGTNINNVLNHYNNIKTNYDAVLVLTDGYYCNISYKTEDIYNKWHFFITKGGIKNIPVNSKYYKI